MKRCPYLEDSKKAIVCKSLTDGRVVSMYYKEKESQLNNYCYNNYQGCCYFRLLKASDKCSK